MENTFGKILSTVEVLEPLNADGFQLFGLKRPGASSLSYLTLDEALEKHLIDVTEISTRGQVSELRVSNKADSFVFLMAGEQLQGAKQNRVLNVSIMIDSGAETSIPVTCVEAGRWHYRSRKFSSARTSSHSALRAMMSKHAAESYRLLGVPITKQTEVWNEVSRKLEKMGSRSPSRALNQLYVDYESKLKNICGHLKLPTGSSGFVFAFGGAILGMDLFDQTATLEKLWPKLLRSYVIDAMEEPGEPATLTLDAITAWLKTVSETESEKFRSPGLGDDVRFEADRLVGSALVLDGQAVHTEILSVGD